MLFEDDRQGCKLVAERSGGHLVRQRTITTTLRRLLPLTIDHREIWAYRELLYFFVWRDIKVRYKQTVIGAAWAI